MIIFVFLASSLGPEAVAGDGVRVLELGEEENDVW